MVAASRRENLAGLLKKGDLLKTKAYVNGEWVDAADGKTFKVINPATGAILAEVPDMPRSQIKQAIEHASAALPAWSALTAYQRQGYLLKLLRELEDHIEDLAIILSSENGKALPEAKMEVTVGNTYISWNAAEAVRIYGHIVPAAAPGTRNHVIKEPIGVCGLITPWNFPNGMITRKIAPALAAGCTVVIKAPAETPLSALALCGFCERVGIPKGVVNVVTVEKGEREAACGLEFCESPLISKISFTGSTAVGRLLMRQSSSTLKKMSMELGGNAAFIVFDDADLKLAIEGVIASKFRASGQTCICANRIYVHAKIYDEFAKLLTERVKGFKVGNPLTEGVNIGPLVSDRGVEKVERHVEDAISKGAKLLVGGKRGSGFDEGSTFFEPTVLSEMPDDAEVSMEETFGPLAALFKFEDEEAVIKSANQTESGLASYIYTSNLSRGHRVSEKLKVGMIGLNTGAISQACIPFGGVKQSGFGREGGQSGIDEYLVEKLVSIGGIM